MDIELAYGRDGARINVPDENLVAAGAAACYGSMSSATTVTSSAR